MVAGVVLSLLTAATAGQWPDVPPGHWAGPDLATLEAHGGLAGYPDGRFHGDRPLTRYELAVFVARLAIRRPTRGLSTLRAPTWQDLPAAHWARPAVAWLVECRGLLREWPGVSGGRFLGATAATRYELAVALAGLLPADAAAGDAADPGWAAPAVARLQALGVMRGDPDGRFHGYRGLSRYEAAVAAARLLAAPVSEAWDPAVPPPRPPVELATVRPELGSLAPSIPRLNLPRLALSFLPEFVSELADTGRGEASGWSMASSGVSADWADGPLMLTASWRYAFYGLHVGQALLARQDQQFQAGAGYRWRWALGERQGELGVFGFGSYLGRRGGATDDLLGMDLQAFGLGVGTQLRWPVAHRLVAVARGEVLPLLGAQFGPSGTVSGQLGQVGAAVGLDWYLDRLSLGVGYHLRYLYDGQERYSQWATGPQVRAGLAF